MNAREQLERQRGYLHGIVHGWMNSADTEPMELWQFPGENVQHHAAFRASLAKWHIAIPREGELSVILLPKNLESRDRLTAAIDSNIEECLAACDRALEVAGNG